MNPRADNKYVAYVLFNYILCVHLIPKSITLHLSAAVPTSHRILLVRVGERRREMRASGEFVCGERAGIPVTL